MMDADGRRIEEGVKYTHIRLGRVWNLFNEEDCVTFSIIDQPIVYNWLMLRPVWDELGCLNSDDLRYFRRIT